MHALFILQGTFKKHRRHEEVQHKIPGNGWVVSLQLNFVLWLIHFNGIWRLLRRPVFAQEISLLVGALCCVKHLLSALHTRHGLYVFPPVAHFHSFLLWTQTHSTYFTICETEGVATISSSAKWSQCQCVCFQIQQVKFNCIVPEGNLSWAKVQCSCKTLQ